MNYNEIAAAWDAQADVLLAVTGTASKDYMSVQAAVLEFRTKAEDCRAAARAEENEQAQAKLCNSLRQNHFEYEVREVEARERQAEAIVKQTAIYAQLIELTKLIVYNSGLIKHAPTPVGSPVEERPNEQPTRCLHWSKESGFYCCLREKHETPHYMTPDGEGPLDMPPNPPNEKAE